MGLFQKFSLFYHLSIETTTIGCTEMGQIGLPIGMTVHSSFVESFEKLLDIEKAQFFLTTL